MIAQIVLMAQTALEIALSSERSSQHRVRGSFDSESQSATKRGADADVVESGVSGVGIQAWCIRGVLG